jgi:hypothetical protein
MPILLIVNWWKNLQKKAPKYELLWGNFGESLVTFKNVVIYSIKQIGFKKLST